MSLIATLIIDAVLLFLFAVILVDIIYSHYYYRVKNRELACANCGLSSPPKSIFRLPAKCPLCNNWLNAYKKDKGVILCPNGHKIYKVKKNINFCPACGVKIG